MNRFQRRHPQPGAPAGVGLNLVGTTGRSPEEQQAETDRLAEEERFFEDQGDIGAASPGTTMAVLAHQWFTLAQQREASRLTQERFIKMQQAGRTIQRDGVLRQFQESGVELALVEEQIVEVLKDVGAREGIETALALLAAQHLNMVNDVSVRFPPITQAKLAFDAGFLPQGDAFKPEGEGSGSTPEEGSPEG